MSESTPYTAPGLRKCLLMIAVLSIGGAYVEKISPFLPAGLQCICFHGFATHG